MITPEQPPQGNTTGRRALDRLGHDPRVHEITYSGGVYTLVPRPGWTCDPRGAHAAVESTIAELRTAARRLTACACAECAAEVQ